MNFKNQLAAFFAVAFCFLLIENNSSASSSGIEDPPIVSKQSGILSFGVRNTYSLFGEHITGAYGAGAGGQFRIQLSDRVNTEWFGDVISTNILNKVHRTDYHIGWSVMYYPMDTDGFTKKFTPYIAVGHCFDQTQVRINGRNGAYKSRFSSAVQAGAGAHYNISPRLDITLLSQYMLHLGNEVHTHLEADGTMEIEEHSNAGWEGHLLITFGVNYKLIRLWNSNK